MSVTLSPAQSLGFARPLTILVKRTLSVTNNNAHPIAFKVKTTAPKQYCVRPNSGRIEPGETVSVQVLLQPMKEDPAPGTKCRDKFLVQSVIITPERETSSLPELWTIVEKEDKATDKESASIHEQKIRCTYLPAEEHEPILEEPLSSVTSAPASEGEESHFKAPLVSTPPISTFTQATADADTSTTADASFSTLAFEPLATSTPPSTSTPPTNGDSILPPLPAPIALPKQVLAPIVPDLSAELATARAEIASLKSQLATANATASDLRQRKSVPTPSVAAGGATMEKVIQHPGSVEGVPINVVAGIVAATFVFTWLFF